MYLFGFMNKIYRSYNISNVNKLEKYFKFSKTFESLY